MLRFDVPLQTFLDWPLSFYTLLMENKNPKVNRNNFETNYEILIELRSFRQYFVRLGLLRMFSSTFRERFP